MAEPIYKFSYEFMEHVPIRTNGWYGSGNGSAAWDDGYGWRTTDATDADAPTDAPATSTGYTDGWWRSAKAGFKTATWTTEAKGVRNWLEDKWRNRPPRNPTQTMYTRFLEKPSGEIKTSYMKRAEESFNKHKDVFKNKYTDILERLK